MKYKPRLDGLRCIAIMMVLFEHFAYYLGTNISAGFYGVNLFFVLSGFLITSILLGDSDSSFGKCYKNFIARRALRIFPVYYLVILLLYVLDLPGISRDISYLATYTYNYQLALTRDWTTIYTPYWSLSVEEQFYLIFPLLVILLRRKHSVLFVITVLIILVAYVQIFTGELFNERLNYTHLVTNMSALGLGALGAILYKNKLINGFLFTSVYAEIAILVLLTIVLTLLSWEMKLLLCPLINLFFVLKCATSKFSINFLDKFLLHKYTIHTGRVSYGIYLYHMIVAFYLGKFLFDPLWTSISFDNLGVLSKIQYHSYLVKFPAYSIASIGVASLSFWYLEAPLLKLKDRYFKS